MLSYSPIAGCDISESGSEWNVSGNVSFWSGPDSLYRNCNCKYPLLLHCWLTHLLQSDSLDPVMHLNNLLCTHLSASTCEGDAPYKRSLLWKVGSSTKWHQTGIRYFHNILTVPWGILLWASWDFHHLSDNQISVTCKESAGLWLNYVTSTEKLGGFHTNSPGTRGTPVLFTWRVAVLTYLSVP